MAEFTPKVHTILFLGPTGSGKGVQSKLLSEKTGFEVFSTGDRYREIRAEDSDIGRRTREHYDQGLLFPSWFSTFLFQEEFMYKPFTQGVICEALGKTPTEAQNFDDMMEWIGRPYVAIYLNISEAESMRRQLIRKEGGHRPDSDTEEKIKVRFAEYNAKTAPAIDFFRSKGKVIDVDGERSVEEIHADIVERLKSI